MVLTHLSDCLDEEVGPYNKRPTCQKFEQWVLSAGKSIRGSKRKKEKGKRRIAVEAAEVKDDTADIFANIFYGLDDLIWPLQLVDSRDTEQFKVLYPLLYKLPHSVMHYLNELIFPEMLAHQGLKLTTCGQEIGGDMLFGRRIGFSGTPSDILPLELGQCQFERGSDGKVVHYLTSPDIVQCINIGVNWNAKSLLNFIANVRGQMLRSMFTLTVVCSLGATSGPCPHRYWRSHHRHEQ